MASRTEKKAQSNEAKGSKRARLANSSLKLARMVLSLDMDAAFDQVPRNQHWVLVELALLVRYLSRQEQGEDSED